MIAVRVIIVRVIVVRVIVVTVMEGRRSCKQNWLNWEEAEMSMLQLERKRMWAVLQVEERRRKILINLM